MYNVDCGVPCQNTTASGRKLLPLMVIVKGTLLTGTLPGVNSAIEGGEDMNTLAGSPWDDPGVPHPIRSRLTRRRLMYRITTSRSCQGSAGGRTTTSDCRRKRLLSR